MDLNNTWTITHLPPNKKPITCKWLFKLKLNSNGTVAKHKARLLARGFTQQYGLDFQETFSHVAKITTLRLILSLAASQHWHLAQLDMNNAFLNDSLDEEIYMHIPQGYNHEPPSRSSAPLVYKLNKSIYGLKQASRSWFNKFRTTLTSQDYRQSKYDYTLFTKGTGSSSIAILVYVDDIVIASLDKTAIHSTKIMLQQYFKLKDLGDLKFFLGLKLSRSQVGIFMCQRHYTMSILEDIRMLACKLSAVYLWRLISN